MASKCFNFQVVDVNLGSDDQQPGFAKLAAALSAGWTMFRCGLHTHPNGEPHLISVLALCSPAPAPKPATRGPIPPSRAIRAAGPGQRRQI